MSLIQCISWRLGEVWRKWTILGFFTPSAHSSLENTYRKFFFLNYSTKKETLTNKLPIKQCPKSVVHKSVVPGPSAWAGNLLEIQILEPLPRPADCGILGVGLRSMFLTSPPNDSNASHNFGATVLGKLLTWIHNKLSWHRDLEIQKCKKYFP